MLSERIGGRASPLKEVRWYLINSGLWYGNTKQALQENIGFGDKCE